jgi:acyl carrier protein
MSVESRVLDVIGRVVEPRHRDKVHPGAWLFEEKLLDSFGIVTLVGEIEQEFGIAIQTEELIPANFAAVPNVVQLVERLMGDAKS